MQIECDNGINKINEKLGIFHSVTEFFSQNEFIQLPNHLII